MLLMSQPLGLSAAHAVLGCDEIMMEEVIEAARDPTSISEERIIQDTDQQNYEEEREEEERQVQQMN